MDTTERPIVSVGLRVALVAAVYAVISWIGNASYAAALTADLPYNDTVDFGQLFNGMTALSLGDIASAATESTFPFINSLMFVTAVGLLAASFASAQWRPRIFTGLALLTVPYGLLGLITFIGPFDGEFFVEGWSVLQAFTFWSLFVCAFTGVAWIRSINAQPPEARIRAKTG